MYITVTIQYHEYTVNLQDRLHNCLNENAILTNLLPPMYAGR